jgi:hypothetical protein
MSRVKRTARKQDEQALLGVSGECGERQAVLSKTKNCGLGKTLFAQLAYDAGVRLRRPLTRRELAPLSELRLRGEKWTTAGCCVD